MMRFLIKNFLKTSFICRKMSAMKEKNYKNERGMKFS